MFTIHRTTLTLIKTLNITRTVKPKHKKTHLFPRLGLHSREVSVAIGWEGIMC